MKNYLPVTWGESDRALFPKELRRPLEKMNESFLVERVDKKGKKKKHIVSYSSLCSNFNWRFLLSTSDLATILEDFSLKLREEKFERWLDFPVLPEFRIGDSFNSSQLSLLRHTHSILIERGLDWESLDSHLQYGSFLTILNLTDDLMAALDLVLTARGYLDRAQEFRHPESLSELFPLLSHYVLLEHGFSRDLDPLRNQLLTMIGLRLGLHEDGPQTLQSISDSFGITRERVRQITRQWTHQDVELSRIWVAPLLIESLFELLSTRQSWNDDDLNHLLDTEFQTQWTSPSQTVSLIMKMVRHEPTFTLLTETELVSFNDSRVKFNLPKKHDVRRAILHAGSMSCFALIDDVLHELSMKFPDIPKDVMNQVIREEAVYGYLPLDYVFSSGHQDQISPVSRALLMLAWAGELSIDELRIGLDRYGRFRKMPPPPPNEVLRAFYGLRNEFEVIGDLVRATIPTNRGEDTVEGQIALLCEQHDGAVISKTLIQDHFRQLGRYTSSASMYITYSPILRPAGKGCITIVGRSPTSDQIEAARELASHLTVDSHVSWSYTPANQVVEILVGTAFRDSGVISVSNTKARWLAGHRLRVLSEEMNEHGSLSVSGSFLYGFTPFFNAMRIDAGDTIQVEIDTKEQVALIRVNPLIADL